MLKGEAINYGKRIREDIGKQTEGAVFMANAEEFKQFLDAAIWEMNNRQNVKNIPSKRISELMEDMLEEMCDNYCKYPGQYSDSDEDQEALLKEHCDTCPLMRW